jgi:outer membrane autotransporter protein
LALTGDGSIASSSSVIDNGTLDISAANAGASIQSLSGPGQVALGAQTLTLTNASDTFSGVIAGTGGVTIAGGTETLTGVNTYSGPTTVAGGALVLNGALPNSVVSLGAGGSLQGSGTVANIATGAGSVISPGGAAFGTLAPMGDLTLAAGSIYQVKTNAAGQSDLIAVGGNATIAGSAVQVVAAPGAYARNTGYTILTAAGGVNGAFSGVTSNFAFLTPTLFYLPNAVNLVLSNNAIPFQSVATTPNQVATATALYASNPSSALYSAVLLSTDAGARQAFDALSGEIYATAPTMVLDESHYVRDAVFGRLRQASDGAVPGSGPEHMAPAGGGLTAWAQYVGASSRGEAQDSGNTAASQSDTTGVVIGVDGQSRSWRVGGAFAQLGSDIKVAGRNSSDSVQSSHVALYAGGPVFGHLKARLGVDYAWNAMDSKRMIVFPGFSDQAGGHYQSRTEDAFGELGYGMTFDGLAVEPFGNLAYVKVSTDGFAEGGGTSVLRVASNSIDAVISDVGARAGASFRLNATTTLQPYASIAWRHLYSNVRDTAAMTFASTGAQFAIGGLALDRDEASVEAGLSMKTDFGVTLTAAYVGQLSSRWQDHEAKLAVSWTF